MTVVYIQWEGRTYCTESFFKDMSVAAHNMKDVGPYWSLTFDVGILVSDSPHIDLSKVLCTRHGEVGTEDMTDIEDLGFHLNINNWDTHPSLAGMVSAWYREEKLGE